MSDKIISIFDRFSSSKPTDQAETKLEAYQAATLERLNRRSLGIKISYSDGRILQIDYAYLKYVVSDVPEILILVFTIGAVVTKGRNLRLLLDDLLDQKVRSLQPFNPALHKPAKDDSVMIDTIEWQSMKTIQGLMSLSEA